MAYESAKTITEQGLESLGRYYSVYRAMVVNNTDPDHMNRIKVAIPEVMGGIVLWAYSKGQHGSTGSGFKMMAPKNGDIVYIPLNMEILVNLYGNIMVGLKTKYPISWMIPILWV